MRLATLPLLLVSLACLFSSPPALAQLEPFLGQIMIVPYNFAPRGWETCDGQIMSISQNTALFSLLGTTYGGDGRTTFALPDLRGRVPIGMGQGPGLSNYVQGETGGEETVTLTLSQIPSHTHVPQGSPTVANTGSPAGANWAMPRVLLYSSGAPSVGMSGAALGSTGGNQPHDNMKPYLVMTYVIAVTGVFPSRG
ncbi:MAG: tail fiber protein [Candidatus Acidiferrales bacterium]